MEMLIDRDLAGAKWARVAGLGDGRRDQAQAALFRLEFRLEGPVQRAELRVSAADRYRLYVNGESLVSGPRKGDQWNRYYETVDLAPHLRPGDNSLTARVVSYAFESAQTAQNAPLSVYVAPVGPLFLAEGGVQTADGATLPLSTGEAAWTACADESFGLDTTGAFYVGATEKFFAARCLPWREAAHLALPAAETGFATEINPYGEFSPLLLKKRRIPNQRETPGAFVRQLPNLEGEGGFAFDEGGRAVIPAGQTRAVELDAGVLRTAYLRLAAKGAGGRVRITYAERYFPKDEKAPKGPMRRDDRVSGVLTGFHDEVETAAEERTFENFWFRTFRFVRIEATAGKEPLCLAMPEFLETGYPLEVQAEFDFPDERMRRLWEISVRTLKRCMHDTHEDCPYYEQLQYTLDTRLQMLFTYAVSGDARMAANVLWDYHCSRLPDGILQSRYPCTHTQVIPDFAIHWIYMLEEYALQTGDLEPIRFYKPTMDGVLDYFARHRGESGLVENLGYWEFGDWVEKWDDHAGVPDATWRGPATLHNLTYALGLRTAARMMRLTGGEDRPYDERADEICARVRALAWDEGRGVLLEGPGFDQVTQHSQALGVLTGALSAQEGRRAMLYALSGEEVLPCTFPWQFTLFRALEAVGLYDRTAPIWDQYFEMLDRNLTTVPERPGETRSDCHAWSALPLYEVPRMLLGVQPAAPGWARIRVEPHAVGLDRLSGTVPTPKGPVAVRWEKTAGGALCVAVEGPKDVPLELVANGKTVLAVQGRAKIGGEEA